MPRKIDWTGRKFGKLTAIKALPGFYVLPGGIKKRKWQFQCDCGTIKDLLIDKVIRKKDGLKSCGCIRANQNKGDMVLYYAVFIQGASPDNPKRNKKSCKYSDGDLSFERFIQLVKMDCYYCNREPSNKCTARNKKSHILYSGLDRLDNNFPHNENNIVPCCKICNTMKRSMSHAEFLDYLSRIRKNVRSKINPSWIFNLMELE